MICEHLELDAHCKASSNGGKFFVAMRVWCTNCLGDFEFTEQVERSFDLRQVLIQIRPAAGVLWEPATTWQ